MHDDDSTDPTTPIAPITPSGRRRSRSTRMVLSVGVAASVAVVVVASVTFLGRNASAKYSSVASAICDSRLPVRGAGGVVVPPAEVPPLAQLCGGSGAFAATPAQASPPVDPTAASTVPSPAPSTTPTAPVVDALDAPDARPPAGHTFGSTATMTVRVDASGDVNAKKEMAIALAEAGGGGLFGEDTTFDGDARATITLKVLPTKFRSLLTDLGKLGVLEAQQVKTDDVTQQVIDLDARLTTAQEGLDRMRGLLSKASNLADVATLEADVSRRQTEVEQLRGQQQTLAQRVDLATVILTIRASATLAVTATTVPAAPAGASSGTLPGFADGLQGGWKVFTNVGTVALAGLGAALPFLPFAVIGLISWRVGRRRRLRIETAAPKP